MKWKKKGLIIMPKKEDAWLMSHAMVPTVQKIGENVYRVYCSGRDDQNRSLIGYADIKAGETFGVVSVSKRPVLSPGELGCFDDNGVTPSWVVDWEGKQYLYYIGWKPRSTTRMSLVAGLAVSNDGGKTYVRYSKAPILHRTNLEPLSILTGPCVLKEGGLWRMWYVSGVEWVNADLPRYNIKYAESSDGIAWAQKGIVCIDFKSGDETALARPCVIKDRDVYRMWFSYKTEITTYRIGYAESEDGIDWNRMDECAGIDVSESGWDSEMIAYSCVFENAGQWYMLYNGNGYGRSGIGLAVLE